MRDRRQLEIIAGRVGSDGVIIAGDGFTSIRTGAGAYQVNLIAPGFRLLAVTISPQGDGYAMNANILGPLVFNTTIRVMNTAVLTDVAFGFIAVGAQQ